MCVGGCGRATGGVAANEGGWLEGRTRPLALGPTSVSWDTRGCACWRRAPLTLAAMLDSVSPSLTMYTLQLLGLGTSTPAQRSTAVRRQWPCNLGQAQQAERRLGIKALPGAWQPSARMRPGPPHRRRRCRGRGAA